MSDLPDWLRPASYFVVGTAGLMVEYRDAGKWAVVDRFSGDVWNFRTKEFVWEPRNSALTDEFKRSTRRPLSECIEVVEGMRTKS